MLNAFFKYLCPKSRTSSVKEPVYPAYGARTGDTIYNCNISGSNQDIKKEAPLHSRKFSALRRYILHNLKIILRNRYKHISLSFKRNENLICITHFIRKSGEYTVFKPYRAWIIFF